MTDKIKDYLLSLGYENIYIDMMPAFESAPEAVGILEWNNPRAQFSGEITHYIQMQVRSINYDTAKAVCSDILSAFDSGENEALIQLNENASCISRVRRGPLILERGSGYTTFYGEIAVWMNNE